MVVIAILNLMNKHPLPPEDLLTPETSAPQNPDLQAEEPNTGSTTQKPIKKANKSLILAILAAFMATSTLLGYILFLQLTGTKNLITAQNLASLIKLSTPKPTPYPGRSPSPTPFFSAGQELTYLSNELGFSFSYKYDPVFTEIKKEENKVELLYIESVVIFELVKDTNSHDWYQELVANAQNNSSIKYSELKDVNIASVSGQRAIGYADRANTIVTLIPNNQDLFVITSTLNQTLTDEILSTFKFVDTTNEQETGARLQDIKYTLPENWETKLDSEKLMLSPKSGGGYLSITVGNYDQTTDTKIYFCQKNNVCIDSTYFTETSIGNISGFKADSLDNSGSGPMYFGTKGDKFYSINSYNPPSPNEFENSYLQILSTLIF